ncbi:S8 family peptidase [Clostridium butyricum]|uniref:S8 family peptidase n=1 Tax=Clostridium butyricum TaxID=1492 RepID=UPI0013D66B54|nr:S8 family peptidase [Clostridium butyricum]MCQ2017588.1 S8 family peptidase [Clostridium butyricum]MCQ2023343.1 S8 family peptidase [Clostridium butyricum]NFB73493.1 peptidase S8 [Clostridium butyricum]NFB91172.1 peptidase S8 [Clostridium butyricum]UTY53208.1 S8 family peptidase [Clostridium butyricum]
MPESILKDKNHYHFLVHYQGDIKKEMESYPSFFITIINDKYAILSLPTDKMNIIDDGSPFSTIVYIKPTALYTLQQISPAQASQANFLQLENLPLNLTGKGVTVAIVDTGIDYLSEEFMDYDGNSRIDLIWDQTIDSDKPPSENPKVPFGTVYTNEEIQAAINEKRKGNDPYTIVPSKDEYGHGTKMAGLIGATGKNPLVKGIVPECRFISIKLIEDISYKEKFGASVPIFNIAVLFSSLQFLYEHSLISESPLVIYFPLGSNMGYHRGNGIFDQFINFISIHTDIIIVTCTGNEAMTNSHASGQISEEEKTRVIDLDIPPEEKNIAVEIWVEPPNILSIDVISPSGENTGIVNSLLNNTVYYKFIFEKTSLKVNYYIPEEYSGNELIRLRFYDLQPGIWKLRLSGDLVLDATFNIWIAQKGIISPNTRLSPSDTYGTITNPGNSEFAATIAAYNQNNNNILNYSGVAFSYNYINTIDVAGGGVNALTVAPDNKTDIVNGTSVASAIAAGACAMLFQWGTVNKNDPYMYAKTIKTYLSRGVSTRPGDIYPNPQWGYGMLNILNMFKNMN